MDFPRRTRIATQDPVSTRCNRRAQLPGKSGEADDGQTDRTDEAGSGMNVLSLAFAILLSPLGPVQGRLPSPSERPPDEPASRIQTPDRSLSTAESRAPESYANLLRTAEAGWDIDGVTAMRSALAALAAGRVADAARGFDVAATRLPGLSDWARLYGAEMAGRRGDTAGVSQAVLELEPHLARERGALVLAAARRSAGDVAGAVAALAPATASTDAGRRAAAFLLLGELRLAARDTANAIAALRASIQASPASSSALAAARRGAGLTSLTTSDQAAIGNAFLRHGSFDLAITHLDRSLRRAAPAETAAVRIDIARALVNARRYAEAVQRLPRLRRAGVPPAIMAEATVLLARVRLRQGRTDEALALLVSVDSSQPAAATGLFLRADLEHDRNRVTAASALYRRVIAEHPASGEAFEAAMRLGGLEFIAGRYDEAATAYETAAQHGSSATSVQRALFWAGRSRAGVGDTARSRIHFSAAWSTDPTTFYGMRSGETLGYRLRTALGESPVTAATSVGEATGAGARIALLLELGLVDDAALERERARRHFPLAGAGLYGVAETLHDRGQTVEAVRLGREIRRGTDGWNERLLRIVYPLPHGERIVQAARDRGLDPFLVAGLIRQESLFNTDARSVAGAIGLMQVMPRTGRELARRDGLAGFATRQLRDPDVNLRLGTLFFFNLLEQHGGAVVYALAAYNAGPSRVARWKAGDERLDPDLFAERIPFAETRDYVRIVQQNARIYAELYGEDTDAAVSASR